MSANAATPGYTRQQTVQATNRAQGTGSGFIGQGVQVDTVKRAYNEFLTRQVAQAKTESSHLDTYFSQMKQIDSLLADSSGRLGLSPALQDFFGSVQIGRRQSGRSCGAAIHAVQRRDAGTAFPGHGCAAE